LLSGGVLARYKDGADQDRKDVKRLAFNVQAGGWSVAGEQNSQDGRIVKAPGTDRVEGGGGNGPGNHGGLGDAGSREQSEPAAKKLLGWGNEIKVGDIGIAIFGTGLRSCDSV